MIGTKITQEEESKKVSQFRANMDETTENSLFSTGRKLTWFGILIALLLRGRNKTKMKFDRNSFLLMIFFCLSIEVKAAWPPVNPNPEIWVMTALKRITDPNYLALDLIFPYDDNTAYGDEEVCR